MHGERDIKKGQAGPPVTGNVELPDGAPEPSPVELETRVEMGGPGEPVRGTTLDRQEGYRQDWEARQPRWIELAGVRRLIFDKLKRGQFRLAWIYLRYSFRRTTRIESGERQRLEKGTSQPTPSDK